MVSSLGVPLYFKVYVCLPAYMNILRSNLSTTRITSQTVACDVMAVDPISIQHCRRRRLLKQASDES